MTARIKIKRKRKRPQRRFEENGNTKFVYGGRTLKGMKEDFTGSHGSKQPVVLEDRDEVEEEEKKEEKEEEKKNKNLNKTSLFLLYTRIEINCAVKMCIL